MLNNLRKYFISGLVVFLPISLTIYLFFAAIEFTDTFFGKLFAQLGLGLGDFRGLSIIVGIYVTYVIYVHAHIYRFVKKNHAIKSTLGHNCPAPHRRADPLLLHRQRYPLDLKLVMGRIQLYQIAFGAIVG